MKAIIVPIYFEAARNDEFDFQLMALERLLAEEASFCEPLALGAALPETADAVVFPQLVGEAYRQLDLIRQIPLPILAVTSEFGTVSMWDWEIVTFLKAAGLTVFAPYHLELTKTICRSLGLKREMKQSKFLVFQDNPGEGMQASIFKRFFWWEDECVNRMKDTFGITIVKKSFKELAARAKAISNEEAQTAVMQKSIPSDGVTPQALNSAIKMYMAVKREVEQDPTIKGVGINCLNESAFSDTTPCLTWSLLYEEKGLMWACEGDILSLLSKYLIHKALKVPVVMSNLYPFLMGEAATKHEKIAKFPDIEEFDNHILVGHCGYFACMPQSFATDWKLKPKVLGIVDNNATAIDGRYPLGDLTIAELHPTLGKLLAVEGILKDYLQFPGSDCRNGALIKVKDGHQLMKSLYSHHGCLIPGHKKVELDLLATVMDMKLEIV